MLFPMSLYAQGLAHEVFKRERNALHWSPGILLTQEWMESQLPDVGLGDCADDCQLCLLTVKDLQ